MNTAKYKISQGERMLSVIIIESLINLNTKQNIEMGLIDI